LANTPPEKRAEINSAIGNSNQVHSYRVVLLNVLFLVAGLKAGYLNPIVGERFALADAAKAHESVINHPSGSAGKIVLLP